MKPFLILTTLFIVGILIVSITMAGRDPTGISLVISWAYMIVAYLVSLVGIGFWRAYLRFQGSRKDIQKNGSSGASRIACSHQPTPRLDAQRSTDDLRSICRSCFRCPQTSGGCCPHDARKSAH